VLAYAIEIYTGISYGISNWDELWGEGLTMNTLTLLASPPIWPAFLFIIVCFCIFVIITIISFYQWKNKITMPRLPQHLQALQDCYSSLENQINKLEQRMQALEDKEDREQ
jgi:biopolymer transport protein ExbB/TolQ